MIIYVEDNIKDLGTTKNILKNFKNAEVINIKNYKNIFDKNIKHPLKEKVYILAESPKNVLKEVPKGYGYQNKYGFFTKTSLNCIFDCEYCFLKGMFKNDFPVIFVDYDNIKQKISDKIQKIRNSYTGCIDFYVSNYTDIQGMNHLTKFNENFIDFFEQFENIHVESRTKSINVLDILKREQIPKNFELAFSINPQEISEKFEQASPALDKRIKAINKLLNKGFKVGLRFQPLIPYDDFENYYSNFLDNIQEEINLDKIYSIFVGGLLYTESDFKVMKDKFPNMKFEKEGNMYKLEHPARYKLYNIFNQKLQKFNFCFDQDFWECVR